MVTSLKDETQRISYDRQMIPYHGSKAASSSFDLSAAMTSGQSASLGDFRESARTRAAYSKFKNWVYVATNAIAKRLAGQPWFAGEVEGGTANPERRYPSSRKDLVPKSLKHAAENANLTVLDDHPVLDTLAQPNPVQKSFEFAYLSAINLLITGQAYWVGGVVKEKGEEDKLELWAVPTNWITPKHEGRLFSSYELNIGRAKIPLPAENVARTYFPHPTDLRGAWSPLFAISDAADIDDHILSSQKVTFQRGPFPNVVLTAGKMVGPDGQTLNHRPTLSSDQRRQIIGAINQVWRQTTAMGDPAIVDGLIESVHKLSNSPAEMDWMESGEQVKRRIMQVYQVNPISVGETVGSNRAQAHEAERQVCQQAVNPLAEAFSESATMFLGPMWETPQRLKVWIEKAQPIDNELELKRWSTARRNDDVSRDEFRSFMGLAEDDRPPRGNLLQLVGGINGASNIMTQVGLGRMPKEVAMNLFQVFFEVEEETAAAMAGMGIAEFAPNENLVQPGQNPVPALPAPDPDPDPDEDEASAVVDAKLARMQENFVVMARSLVAGITKALDDRLGVPPKIETATNDSTETTA